MAQNKVNRRGPLGNGSFNQVEYKTEVALDRKNWSRNTSKHRLKTSRYMFCYIFKELRSWYEINVRVLCAEFIDLFMRNKRRIFNSRDFIASSRFFNNLSNGIQSIFLSYKKFSELSLFKNFLALLSRSIWLYKD